MAHVFQIGIGMEAHRDDSDYSNKPSKGQNDSSHKA